MSILIGIAVLFGIMFAMFSGIAGREFAPKPAHITLRWSAHAMHPHTLRHLLIEGAGFEPDSQLRFIAWYLPDGRGSYQRSPVQSARSYAYRSSSFDDVPFEPAIPLAVYTGEGVPHDIKVIATDDHGNAAEAWISGKHFYLSPESVALGREAQAS